MNTETNTLELVPATESETPTKQLAPYNEYEAGLKTLLATAQTITVTNIAQKAEMTLARATRLELKKVRVAITNRHKELKESILVEGRKIDAGKNKLLEIIEPEEERLLEIEQFAEREAERIATEKRTARVAEISPFLTGPLAVDLGTVADDDYAAMLEDAKAADAARKAKIEADRQAAIAKAKAEAEERERVRLENERLRKEAAEQAELARQERAAHAAAMAKERDEAARVASEAKAKADAEAKRLREEAAERERVIQARAIEAQRIADENARAQFAKAEVERKAREKAEAEIAKRKADEAAAIEAKRLADEAASLAPDKEKLMAFAATVRALELPWVKEDKAQAALNEIAIKVNNFATWIEKQANAL